MRIEVGDAVMVPFGYRPIPAVVIGFRGKLVDVEIRIHGADPMRTTCLPCEVQSFEEVARGRTGRKEVSPWR